MNRGIRKIIEGCEELGWEVGVSDVEAVLLAVENGPVKGAPGLVVGSPEFVGHYWKEFTFDPRLMAAARECM